MWMWISSSVKLTTSADGRRLATSREEGKEEGWVLNTMDISNLLPSLRDYLWSVDPNSLGFVFSSAFPPPKISSSRASQCNKHWGCCYSLLILQVKKQKSKVGFSPMFSCWKIRGDAPSSLHNEFQGLSSWSLISQIDGDLDLTKDFNNRKCCSWLTLLIFFPVKL